MDSLNGRILVTGGAGFIGSALIWALNQRGHTDIVVVDLLGSDEKWKNLRPLRFAEYVEGPDFRQNLGQSATRFGKFSAVFHLGACSATTEKNAGYLIDNNYNFTKELANWSAAQGARFIYASSAATYGDGTHGMEDTSTKLAVLRPLNMYGYSKHLFDLYAQRTGLLASMVGLKYFNVFGPNEDHKGEMRSVVNKLSKQIISGDTTVRLFKSYKPEYADGMQKRDFLYVKDAVEMTLHFATTGAQSSGLFNLGSGTAHSWLDLTEAIARSFSGEKNINVDFIDMPDALRQQYQYFTLANIAKLRATGYEKPITPLRDAVMDYVRNYLIPSKKLGE
ncbi:MAG: ADP-glyceromanno-heptose 6-epimerase [Verrucomicrobiota bacterium]|jgi:ADP-L-glycero-D-manno-heptose 6-epimerase